MPWCTTASCAPASAAASMNATDASTPKATFFTSSPARAICTPLFETSENVFTDKTSSIHSVIRVSFIIDSKLALGEIVYHNCAFGAERGNRERSSGTVRQSLMTGQSRFQRGTAHQ